MPILSKDQRIVWSRRIKGFWEEYTRNKIGILGLVMIAAYVILALISPYLALYDIRTSRELAENYAQPEWVAQIIPAYNDLPRTTKSGTNLVLEGTPANSTITVDSYENGSLVTYVGNQMTTQNFTIGQFDYPYSEPDNFILDFGVEARFRDVKVNQTVYSNRPRVRQVLSGLKTVSKIYITTPNGTDYLIFEKAGLRLGELDIGSENDVFTYMNLVPNASGTNGTLTFDFIHSRPKNYVNSDDLFYLLKYVNNTGYSRTVVQEIFSTRGTYKVRLSMQFEPYGSDPENRTGEIFFAKKDPNNVDVGLIIKGKVFGLLGTDQVGSDVFTQLILGVRISLLIGMIAAILSTTIGVTMGIVSGYIGGAVDELTMRIVDVLMCVPVLPLLLVMTAMYGKSFWYLIIIVALFWWLGLSRVIRSTVLSIREMPYIECAVASGASKAYVMFRHIVPNVLPIALADFVLTVPGAIILESALSFIGFGDPNVPTWGRMLSNAQAFGAFDQDAWWVYVPPGLGIIFLCMTFVFIGHALDEVVNPRLRRRR